LSRPWTLAWALPLLSCLQLSCREQIPSAPSPSGIDLPFRLPLGSYYSYDNWVLYPDGSFIPGSQFRTSWEVIDTDAVAMGFSGVTDVRESTFVPTETATDSLVRIRHRYFRTSAEGDVFEYGFVARLLQDRDSIQVPSVWDKLLSPSSGLDVPWTVETSDSPSVGTIEGRFFPQLETVEDSINGVAMGVLAYHAEIDGTDLTFGLWVGGSPPAFLRGWDQSDVPFNRIFQELRVRRVGG